MGEPRITGVQLKTRTDRGEFVQRPIGMERALTANGPCLNLLFHPVGGQVHGYELKVTVTGDECGWGEIPFDVVNRNYFCRTLRRKVWKTSISEMHYILNGR